MKLDITILRTITLEIIHDALEWSSYHMKIKDANVEEILQKRSLSHKLRKYALRKVLYQDIIPVRSSPTKKSW